MWKRELQYFFEGNWIEQTPIRLLYSNDAACTNIAGLAWKLIKEDPWYVYLETDLGSPGYSIGGPTRVVLLRDSFHVRQAQIATPDGRILLWDITNVTTDIQPPITDESLMEGTPRGWPTPKLSLELFDQHKLQP